MMTAKIQIEGDDKYVSTTWSDPNIKWSHMIVNRRVTVRQVLDNFISEKEDVEIVIVARNLSANCQQER
jgi:hypothetical protein